MPSNRTALVIGALATLSGVILGAFGAHALTDVLTPEQLTTYETAVRYQFYHAFGILIGAILERQYGGVTFRIAAFLMAVGIVLFCGSLYLYVGNLYVGTAVSGFAMITPIGGLFFVGAWVTLLIAIFRHVAPGSSNP